MSNEQKINLWDSADSGMQRSWEREEAQRAMKWLDYPRFDTALAYLDPVPPLRRGTGGTQTKTISEKEKQLRALKKVTSSPDWLETIVTAYKREFARPVPPQRDALAIYRTMIACSRRKPYRDSEVTETMTDDFHLHTVLDPATVIATEMRGEPVFAAYAKGQNGTISDLTVHSVEGGKRTHWAAAEDKRAQVFARHEEEFRGYANYDTFPWPSPERMNDVSSGKRIWIQLWGQMCEYNVDYTKLFSPAGVIYVRRSSPGSSSLIFSKTYPNLDGDVERTVCMILLARIEAARAQTRALRALARSQVWISGWLSVLISFLQLLWIHWYRGIRGVYILLNDHERFFRDVSEQFQFSSAVSPALFTKVVGQGVSGMVVSSSHRSEVVKLFPAKHLAQHEVRILNRACGLAVPIARGFVSDGSHTGVVMTYEGTPIRDLGLATPQQKRQLAAVLASLHLRGIHHHDVHEDNVLVDKQGKVTLIDFHQAVLDPRCTDCSDVAMLQGLEAQLQNATVRVY